MYQQSTRPVRPTFLVQVHHQFVKLEAMHYLGNVFLFMGIEFVDFRLQLLQEIQQKTGAGKHSGEFNSSSTIYPGQN
eukprot:SAG31_NODE_2450_length_5668_cov_32.512300_4_plen_77_part_00